MYGYKNTFTDDVEGFGLSKDIIDSEVLRIDENGNTILENNEFLNDRKFSFTGTHWSIHIFKPQTKFF